MKLLQKKNIPNALLISIGLHILLLAVLGMFYRQKIERHPKPVTAFDIVKIRVRSTVRPPKRVYHRPVHPTTPPENMQQLEKIAVQTPALHVTTPISPQEADLELHTPDLATLSETRERGYRTRGTATPVTGLAGSGGAGNGAGTRRIGNGPASAPKRGLLNGTAAEPPSDIGGLTLPDLALTKIGRHIVANRATDTVDIVFIIDGSGSMKNDVAAVREHLSAMTDIFDAADMDFTIGIVMFRAGTGFSLLGLDFEVIPQTRSVSQIKKFLSQLKFRGDENGLDALIRAADEVRFRRDAEVHFIFVTDEYVSGAYSSVDVMMKMKTAKIKVDVIGRDEPFQKFIAKSTGGLWLPISSLTIQ